MLKEKIEVFRVKIELNSMESVEKFVSIAKGIDCDVRLVGKDENGSDWNLSAKSLLCSLVVEKRLQDREHTAHDLDWNTLWVECPEDIYNKIREFAI